MPDILGRRALPAGRLAALGARRYFHHGLLEPEAGSPKPEAVMEPEAVMLTLDVMSFAIGLVSERVHGTFVRLQWPRSPARPSSAASPRLSHLAGIPSDNSVRAGLKADPSVL
jgi:hypothetical protein